MTEPVKVNHCPKCWCVVVVLRAELTPPWLCRSCGLRFNDPKVAYLITAAQHEAVMRLVRLIGVDAVDAVYKAMGGGSDVFGPGEARRRQG